MFARSASRSFREHPLCSCYLSRLSRSLGFDPRDWGNLVRQNLLNAPEMISHSCRHRRSTRILPMLCFGEFMMRKTEIVRASNQIHSAFQSVQTASGMTTVARERCQTLSHRSIQPFNKRGTLAYSLLVTPSRGGLLAPQFLALSFCSLPRPVSSLPV